MATPQAAMHEDGAAPTKNVAPEVLASVRRQLLHRDERVRHAGFERAYEIGPAAIPLFAEMLQGHRVGDRRNAIDRLIDLAPDTESAQDHLRRALRDPDDIVAGDAARALGALGGKAGPSVPALVEALSHRETHVRIYSAEALASIGPAAAPATKPLIQMLNDPVAGVRWAACEALASIGPAAASAVPQLIRALGDETLFVRICAAGALGAIGAEATPAVKSLQDATKDPALRDEAAWALSRITGVAMDKNAPTHPGTPLDARENARSAPTDTPTLASGSPPTSWDAQSLRNITWSIELGNETLGRPVFSGGVVYVGTDNARQLNPEFRDECGVLMAFRASDGAFLWQDLAPSAKRGLREFLLPSTTSAPYVVGDRLYYMTAECQLRCLDTDGFRDGKNNGPFQSERFLGEETADIVWELDLCAAFGVFPHEASNSEVLPVGDLLIVCTGNGRNEGHTRVPSPRAPSLVAVAKHTGKPVWCAIGAGEHVLHGQWCSPVAANVNGRTEVLFGGGDGWLRAYDAFSGRELWRFDGNPKDAPWRPRPGVFSRGSIIASPIYDDGRVFVAMGEDPTHGNGPSLLHAVSPNGQNDVTDTRRLWTCREVGRVVATPVVKDGLLYVGDLGGIVYCIDAPTGAVLWKHDTCAAIWGCLSLIGERLYVGNVEGTMTVLRAGARKEVITEFDMDDSLYARPAAIKDTLYLATARRLYRIEARP